MINTTADMKEKGLHVVVPKWKGNYDGYFTVDRVAMTDAEWKTWLSVSKGEIMRQVSLYMKDRKPAQGLQKHIVDFLVERGVDACPA